MNSFTRKDKLRITAAIIMAGLLNNNKLPITSTDEETVQYAVKLALLLEKDVDNRFTQ